MGACGIVLRLHKGIPMRAYIAAVFAPFVLLGLSVSAQAQTFHGYGCTQDCSGHEAGYNWAEENGITDPDDCDGNSQSFTEGCQAYAEEEGPSYDDQGDDDDPYANDDDADGD